MNAPVAQLTPPNASAVEIEDGDQPWCEIRLKNGYKLRVQVNVRGIYEVHGQTTPDGLPVFTMMADMNVQAFKR